MRRSRANSTHRFGQGNESHQLRRADEVGREAVAQRLDKVAEGAAGAHPLLHVFAGCHRRLSAAACAQQRVGTRGGQVSW